MSSSCRKNKVRHYVIREGLESESNNIFKSDCCIQNNALNQKEGSEKNLEKLCTVMCYENKHNSGNGTCTH